MWKAIESGTGDHYHANIVVGEHIAPSGVDISIAVGEVSGSSNYYTQFIGASCALKLASYLITSALRSKGRLPQNLKVEVSIDENNK